MERIKNSFLRSATYLLMVVASVLFISSSTPDKRVEIQLLKADSLLKKGTASVAREIYKVVKDSSSDAKIQIKAQTGIISSYLKEGKLDTASMILNKTFVAADTVLDPEDPLMGTLYKLKAYEQGEMAVYDSSLYYYYRALFIFKKAGTPHLTDVMNTHNNIARLLIDQDKIAEAHKQLKQALGYLNSIPPSKIDSSTLSTIYNNIGVVFFYKNQLDSSLQYYDRSRTIATMYFGENHPKTAQAISNIAMVKEVWGYFTDALFLYEKALGIYRDFYEEEHPLIAEIYGALGNIYLRRRDFDKALQYFSKDMDITIALYGDDHPLTAFGWQNKAMVYLARKEYDKAIESSQKALAIRRKNFGESHINLLDSEIQLADAYLEKGDLPKARNIIQEALQHISDEKGLHLADAYIIAGKIEWQSKKLNAAEAYFSKAIAIYEQLLPEKHPDLSTAYLWKAKCFPATSALTLSFVWTDKALEAALSPNKTLYGTPKLTAEDIAFERQFLAAKEYKGELYMSLFKHTGSTFYLDKAISQYLHTIPLIHKIRQRYASDDALNDIYLVAEQIFKNGMMAAVERFKISNNIEDFDNAFYFSEQLKNNQLLEAIQGLDAYEVSNIPESTLRREYQLKKDIQYYKSQLLDSHQDPSLFSPEQVKEMALKLEVLYQQQLRFYKNLERYHPNYFKLKYASKFAKRKELQEHIVHKKQRLLSYVFCENKAYIFVIGDHTQKVVISQLPASENRLNQLLKEKGYHGLKADLLFGLTNSLLPKLVLKDGIDDLIIIPDGFMKYMPLEGLRRNAKYLVQDYSFIYSPSATIYSLKRKNQELVNKTVLTFAPGKFSNFQLDALPGSLAEVTDIEKYLKTMQFSGDNATESSFKKESPDYGILHIATHAATDPFNPLKSRLYFSPDKNEDGILYAYEIYGLPMRIKLATLSACATGSGLDNGAQGFQSMANAFAYNGCSNVLMCMWPIRDDVSAFIMDRFYFYLSEGNSKQKSLQLAKTAFLAQADRYDADPYIWSGFVLQGDYSELNLEVSGWSRLWWLPAILFLLFAIVFNRDWLKSGK